MQDKTYTDFVILIVSLIMCLSGWMFMFSILSLRRKLIEKEKIITSMEAEKELTVFRVAAAAEEQERERIARNLHDEVNSLLAIHKQALEKHRIDFQNNNFNTEAYDHQITEIETIRHAVNRCATDLVPAFFLRNGLMNTLEDHIRRINYAGKIKARFYHENTGCGGIRFSKQDALNIYRITLELINNLLKHTHLENLTLKVITRSDLLLIEFCHDGRRTNNLAIHAYTSTSKGFGLKSVKARLQILHASIDYSDVLKNPAIRLRIPYNEEGNNHN
jgi:signal transduction histidine kinase